MRMRRRGRGRGRWRGRGTGKGKRPPIPPIVREYRREIKEAKPPSEISLDLVDLDEWTTAQEWIELYISKTATEKILSHCITLAESNLEAMGFLIGDVYQWKGNVYTVVRDTVTTDLETSSGGVRFHRDALESLVGKLSEIKTDYILVGWYHSHPGLEVFLSPTDIATQRKTFNQPYHSALVVDPINRQMKAYKLFGDYYAERLYRIFDDTTSALKPKAEVRVRAPPVVRAPKVKVSKLPAFVDFSAMRPRVRHFFGREKDLKQLNEWLSAYTYRLIIIRGIAGIGKRTIASKLISQYRGKRHLFWYDLREWDTIRHLLTTLSEFLARAGNKELHSYINYTKNIDIHEASRLLIDAFENLNAVLVFNDFHKADERIVYLFSRIAEALEYLRKVCIILLTQEETPFTPKRMTAVKNLAVELELKGLTEEGCREFLLAKDIEGLDFEKVYELTKGHPLSIELIRSNEYLEYLGDIRKFVREEIFSKLSADEKSLLMAASVYRRPARAEAFFVDDSITYETLEHLVSRSLVHLSSFERYSPHDIIKEFFYSRLTPALRRKYHTAAGDYYISAVAVDAEGDLGLIEAAYHYLKAGKGARAAKILIEKGAHLIEKGYLEELMSIIVMFGALPPTEASAKYRGELLKLKGDILLICGEWDNVLEYYRQSFLLADFINLELSREQIHRGIGRLGRPAREWESGYAELNKSIKVLEEVGDFYGLAEVYRSLGWMSWLDGRYAEAIEHYRKSIDVAALMGSKALAKLKGPGEEDKLQAAKAYLELGNLYWEKGDFTEAAGCYNNSIKTLEDLSTSLGEGGERRSRDEVRVELQEIARAYNNLGNVYTDLRDPRALDCYSKSLQYSERIGFLRSKPYTLLNLGEYHIKNNNHAVAEKFLERALREFTKQNDRLGAAYTRVALSVIHSIAGRWGRAERYIEESIAYLRSSAEVPFYLAEVYIALSRVYRGKRETEKARVAISQARELLEKLGLREVEFE